MDERTQRVSALLEEAADLHHRVYRITGGADEHWAAWYADWLVQLSELGEVLGTTPSVAELRDLLVHLDGEYSAHPVDEPWHVAYARGIASHFTPR